MRARERSIRRWACAIVAMLLLLCSCRPLENSKNGETTESDGTLTSAEAVTNALETESEKADIGSDGTETDGDGTDTGSEKETEKSYEDMECREPDGYVEKQFAVSSKNVAFNLNLPNDWNFEVDDEGNLAIVRDGENIGNIVVGKADASGWSVHRNVKLALQSTSIRFFVESCESAGKTLYRHRVEFSSVQNANDVAITLTVDYAELSTSAKNKLYKTECLFPMATQPNYGIISEDVTSGTVAIIGNSFINSSDIGEILREMCSVNGKSIDVQAYSRGYAHVSTYTNDGQFMDLVRSGAYSIIFVCGFYSEAESASLGLLKAACAASGTRLVIFPAHNESAVAIRLALAEHPELLYLDWKGELDALIANGVDKWELCINDAHLHSTPLAGYVGAHMIYRAIYGEAPQKNMLNTVPFADIMANLKDYYKTGTISYVGSDAIYLD